MPDLERYEIAGIPTFESNGHEWSAIAYSIGRRERIIPMKSKLTTLDAHDDMNPCKNVPPSEDAIIEKSITCGNFLPACIFAGFFNTVEWVVPPRLYNDEFSTPLDENAMLYTTEDWINFFTIGHRGMPVPSETPNEVNFRYRICEPENMMIEDVLGFDFDFYCPVRAIITAKDPISVFMSFRRGYSLPSYRRIEQYPSVDEVIMRVDTLCEILETQPRPKLISFARSDTENAFILPKYVMPIRNRLIENLTKIYR